MENIKTPEDREDVSPSVAQPVISEEKKKTRVSIVLLSVLVFLIFVPLAGLVYLYASGRLERLRSISGSEHVVDNNDKVSPDVCDSLNGEYAEAGNLLNIKYSKSSISTIEIVQPESQADVAAYSFFRKADVIGSTDDLYIGTPEIGYELFAGGKGKELYDNDAYEKLYTCNDAIGYIVNATLDSYKVVFVRQSLSVSGEVVTEGFDKELHIMCSGNVEDCKSLIEGLEIRDGYDQPRNDGSETKIDTSDWSNWQGEYLSSRLPEGWTIEELENEYILGFVGFKIYNELGHELLSVENSGPMGFGPCSCSNYYIYPDTKEDADNKLPSLQTQDTEICGENYINVINVDDYEEVNFLGNRVRFSDSIAFADLIKGNLVFDAGCETTSFLLDSLSDEDGDELDYMLNGDTEPSKLYEIRVGESYSYSEQIGSIKIILENIDIIKEVNWEEIAPCTNCSPEGEPEEERSFSELTDYEQQQEVVKWMKASFTAAGLIDNDSYFLGTHIFDYYDSALPSDNEKFKKLYGYYSGLEHYATVTQYEDIIEYFNSRGFVSKVVFDGDLILRTQLEGESGKVGCVLTRYYDSTGDTETINPQKGRGIYDMYLNCANRLNTSLSSGSNTNIPDFTLGNFKLSNNPIIYISNAVTFNQEMTFLDFYLVNHGFVFKPESSQSSGTNSVRYYESDTQSCTVKTNPSYDGKVTVSFENL